MKNKTIPKKKIQEIARNRRTNLVFVPQRLSVEHRPELYAFPLNVFFMGIRQEEDQSITSGEAVYEPNLHTFQPYALDDGDRGLMMLYTNKYNHDHLTGELHILWNPTTRRYIGLKVVNGQAVCATFGDEWHAFFYELTSKGLYNGEPCKFGRSKEIGASTTASPVIQ